MLQIRLNRTRRVSCYAWLALFALAVGLCSPSAHAAPHHETAAKAPFAAQFAIADFDGDAKPDLASVRFGAAGSSRVLYLIDLRLSGGSRHTYGLEGAAGGVRLASRDVNGDQLLDLVVTSTLTGEPLAVFLNDGRGNFTRSEPAKYPEAFRDTHDSLSTANATDDDRTGAELSRTAPACNTRVERVAANEGQRLPAIPDFRSGNLTGQVAWLGRAPPANVVLS